MGVGSRPGEVVTLTPYTSLDVHKFIFDGNEDFLEMPQAFFHYASWFSNGKEMLFDLQGAENDNGDFILIDPCILRAPKLEISDVLHSGASVPAKEIAPSVERFNVLHKRCGPLCKGFDPDRKGGRGRKMCGIDVHCG